MERNEHIVKAFLEWYSDDLQSGREDYYRNTITEKYLDGLSKEAFIAFFVEFARDGGQVQSGGQRTAAAFQQSITDHYETFREKILEPFYSNFDLNNWLNWADGFKFFGQGLATVYLNRIDKRRYVIVNEKVLNALPYLGFDKPSGVSLLKKYHQIEGAEQSLLQSFPALDNFFRVDALMHFLIGTEEGRIFISNLMENNINTQISQPMKDLNTILYGPPGTGKTYSTKSLALQIIEGKSEEEIQKIYPTRAELNLAFLKYQKDEQIGFVTFHQSFGYEDFIEGIKPSLKDVESSEAITDLTKEASVNSVRYKIEDGIFKIMAERADSYQSFAADSGKIVFDKKLLDGLDKKRFFKMSLGNTAQAGDQAIYEYCIKNNCIALGWGQEIDFSEAKDEGQIRALFNKYAAARSSYEIFAVRCFKLLMKEGDIVFISDGNLKIRAIGLIDGPYYYDEASPIPYNHFRKVKWLIQNTSIPVDQVYERKFSQQTIYEMYSSLVKLDFFLKSERGPVTPQNHVLIIDEINRGNISSIFGELITLIEPDKRKGAKEYLPITLPYSKMPFSVPSNLYIIGTMNTADRSVEALDTALRRRFTFVHMKPEPDKLTPTQDGIDLNKMLTHINKRLEILLDADHTIGHAWLWDVRDLGGLRLAFKDKILPLLQEFFYNDYEKIGLVLGDAFVSSEEVKPNDVFAVFKSESGLADEYATAKLFHLTDVLEITAEQFSAI